MKSLHHLSRLEPLILTPLHDLKGDAWHKAPKGKWSLAQIVSHLAIGLDGVAAAFEPRAQKFGMMRRASPGQALLRHLVLGLGKFPPGREAPERSRPTERPDPEAAVAQFRMGVERTSELVNQWPEQRQVEVFVKHPVFGDLNLKEWVRFHYVHCRHHSRQVANRLKWLAKA
ncbi:MAG TPA: DinB family protein [Gemmatimonadales bacterium]